MDNSNKNKAQTKNDSFGSIFKSSNWKPNSIETDDRRDFKTIFLLIFSMESMSGDTDVIPQTIQFPMKDLLKPLENFLSKHCFQKVLLIAQLSYFQ